MNKYLLILLVLVSSNLWADTSEVTTPVITTSAEKVEKRFNPRESHWLTTFGFEGLKYETPFLFTGTKDNFAPKDVEFWGGRLGVGGEIYLGGGLNTVSKIEGFYVGSLFSEVLNGGTRDADVKFAYTKQNGQVWGFDASQALGWLFDMKTKNPFMDEWAHLTVEPFVEAGVGIARAFNKLNYNYALAGTYESYRVKIEDQLVNARIGAGINFTSSEGYFLQLRVTQNRYDITKRTASGYKRQNGGLETVVSNDAFSDKIKPITIYTLGGGYKF